MRRPKQLSSVLVCAHPVCTQALTHNYVTHVIHRPDMSLFCFGGAAIEARQRGAARLGWPLSSEASGWHV
jgi:hypothetical protein